MVTNLQCCLDAIASRKCPPSVFEEPLLELRPIMASLVAQSRNPDIISGSFYSFTPTYNQLVLLTEPPKHSQNFSAYLHLHCHVSKFMTLPTSIVIRLVKLKTMTFKIIVSYKSLLEGSKCKNSTHVYVCVYTKIFSCSWIVGRMI